MKAFNFEESGWLFRKSDVLSCFILAVKYLPSTKYTQSVDQNTQLHHQWLSGIPKCNSPESTMWFPPLKIKKVIHSSSKFKYTPKFKKIAEVLFGLYLCKIWFWTMVLNTRHRVVLEPIEVYTVGKNNRKVVTIRSRWNL